MNFLNMNKQQTTTATFTQIISEDHVTKSATILVNLANFFCVDLESSQNSQFQWDNVKGYFAFRMRSRLELTCLSAFVITEDEEQSQRKNRGTWHAKTVKINIYMNAHERRPDYQTRAMDSKKQLYCAVKLNKLNKKRENLFYSEWRDEEKGERHTYKNNKNVQLLLWAIRACCF